MFRVPWKYVTQSNKSQLSIEISIMLEVVIWCMWSLRVNIWKLGDTLLICLCFISDLSSCGAEHDVLISSCPRCVPSTWEHIIRHMDHASTEKTETWNYRAAISRQPAELENSMHKIRKPSLNFWDSCYSSGVSHISHYRWHHTRTHQQPVERVDFDLESWPFSLFSQPHSLCLVLWSHLTVPKDILQWTCKWLMWLRPSLPGVTNG